MGYYCRRAEGSVGHVALNRPRALNAELIAGLGEPCPGCSCAEGVRRITQAGRSTFFCAKRQR